MINNVEVKPEEYEEKYDAAWHALRQQQNNKKDKKEDEEWKMPSTSYTRVSK